MVPFLLQRCLTQKRLLVWLEALWGNSVAVEAGWHWRPILYKPPCALYPQGQFTTTLPPRDHQSTPHIWSGAEIVLWSHGEEEAPCFADQNLQSSQKSRGSKPSQPEEQLWKYRSTQGLWESQGSGGLVGDSSETRATVSWVKAWKWTAAKATVTATTSWYLCLGRHRGGNWKTEGWRALWTTQDTAEKRGHSKTCLSSWPWMFCARQRPLEHG